MIKRTVIRTVVCLISSIFYLPTNAQIVIPLYSQEIPNSKKVADEEYSRIEPGNILIVYKVSRPSLTIFLAPKEKATGAAVIICPGGGYSNLAMGYEGTEVAQRFNEAGISAFVLKYRIPNDSTMINKEIGPLQDAQRALLIVRSRAADWGIDPKRVGIMGFSAGGHLAATAGTHFQKSYIDNPDHISLRPDFLLLIYPVISFKTPVAHMGSANNLIGSNPSQELIKEFSNEMQVTDHTPPAFLVHAKDDNVVPYANSLVFAEALKTHHIQSKVFLYEQGGHGFGMTNNTSKVQWMDLCINWISGLNPEN
ncbi:MAG TPA: alpha/beta hydrolase [Puia sp.]|nr:alpha/beta hydrolase [Puia sp.]